MKKEQRIHPLCVLFLLISCAGLWACSGCDDGGGEGDDGGHDPVETPDPTGDLDVVPEDVPVDDAVAHEDVAGDDGPADTVEDEGPPAIAWTLTDLGVAADSYDIARDNSDNVHIIWKEGGSARLLHYGRIETGALEDAFEIPQTTGIFLANKRPRLAVAPDGSTVHTAWVPNGGANLYHIWRDSSGTWQDRETVYTMGTIPWKVAQPSIGADADGNVHIVAQQWCDPTGVDPNPCPADSFRLAYWRKPAAGTWSDWTDIEAASGEWRQTDMVVDRSGGIHAAWKCMANREGHYCHAPSGGTLVGCAPIDLPVPDDATFVSCGSSFSTATEEGGGDVYHATWSLSSTYTIDVARKPAGDDTFTVLGRPSIDAFPLGTGIDPWPVVGVDDFGRIFVSWAQTDEGDGTVDVYVSTYAGDAWNREVMDDDSGVGSDTRSVLAVTGRAAYLVWRAASGNLMLAMTDL
jgi:hypothetical protein